MFKHIKLQRLAAFLTVSLVSTLNFAGAQTDIHIAGAKAGFPVAIPKLCDQGGGGEAAQKIAAVMAKDLQISGLFNVINPASYIEAAGKCGSQESVAYGDWSVIGAEGLVKGEISRSGGALEVKLYLHDVQQRKAVIGKKYDAEESDANKVAHKFANEIVRFFTGEPGIFGTQVAYVSRLGRFKEIFVMDLDGSNQKQLTRDNGLALSPSWDWDNSKIIYTSYRSRKPELYTIPSGGGSPHQLTERPGLELGAKFAPKGGAIITSATVGDVSKIVLLDLGGRLISKLTGGDSIDVSPSYSPDGSQVAFCSNRQGGPQIYTMSSSGEPAKRISFTNSNYCTSPAWSPKGDKIAFVCRSGGNQLFVAPVGGGNPTQLTFAGDNEDPSWSPDGRFLVFSSNLGGGPRGVTVLSLLGGSPVKITNPRAEDSQPAWSKKTE